MAEEDRIHALYPIFLKNYEHVIDVNSYLYEGVVKTLDAILEMDIVLGVCTNKPQKQAKILLDKYSPSDTAAIVSKLTSINKKIIYKHILSIRQKG